MVRNKPRLHIALYACPNLPNSYRYALIVSSKDRSADVVMYHVTNARRSSQGVPSQRWRHEKFTLNSLSNEPRLLVVISVAKVLRSLDEITEILHSVPLYQPEDGDKYQTFSCAEWTRVALQHLYGEKAITGDAGMGDWAQLDQQALKFVQEQKAEAQWDDSGWTEDREIPCLDLLQKQ